MNDKRMIQYVKAQRLALSRGTRDIRMSRFMTVGQVHEVTGLAASTICHIEGGRRLIPKTTAGRRYVAWLCDERYDQ